MLGIADETWKKLEAEAAEILKAEPEFAKASLRLTARMFEMGLKPGRPGCGHLDEGWCALCVERKVKFAELFVKLEQAGILKEAARALHNPERYGIPKVEELTEEIEQRTHLCEDVRILTELLRTTPGEFGAIRP